MKEEAIVRTTLEKIRPSLASEVTDLRFEVGLDSTGDEAIWVWIEMPDDAPQEVWAWNSKQAMRATIRTAIAETDLDRILYIRFTDPYDPAVYEVA